MPNLEHHVGIARSFGIPVVVAVNAFPTDTEGELELVRQGALDTGAFAAAKSTAFPTAVKEPWSWPKRS